MCCGSETLSNGETVTVVIWPRAGRAELAVQRNHQLERGEHCDTVDLAERRGWELHRSVLRGGVRELGADDSVLRQRYPLR